jgi:hypothetical protein
MAECVKCGSNEIDIKWVKDGIILGTCKQQGKRSDFISYVARAFDSQIVCKKEHLLKTCSCCKYEWREDTLDKASTNQTPPGDD